jgi:gliding motility-associated-like protein
LPATGTWTLTRTPGGTTTTGTGTSTTITGLAAGTYTYTVTNAAGCVSGASGNVVINAQPASPTAPSVGTITQPTCTLSTGSVVLNGLPATGTWTLTRTPGGTTTTGTGTSTTITGLAAGTYTYTVSNAAGCTSASSANVVINAQPATPTATASNNGPVCSGTALTLTGGPAGMTTYAWTGPNGFTSSLQNPTVSASATIAMAGTYTLRVTNSFGCQSIATTSVVVTVSPNANAGSGGNECDLNHTFSAVPSVGTGIWTRTTGPGTATFTPDANTPNATVTVSAYGNYTFTWTETNSPCSNSSTITVNFYQQPVANAGPGGNNCGVEFNLRATQSVGTGTWTRVSGPGNATFSPNLNAPNAKVTITVYGTYVFRWTEVNGTCSSNAAISVIFIQQPSANGGNGGNECDKDFLLNAVQGAVPGTWTKISGPGNVTFSPNHNTPKARVTVTQFGAYDFAWTEVNSLCTSTDIIRVTFNDLPSVYAGADVPVCEGGSIQLQAIGSGSFLWTPTNLVNNPNISNPVASPTVTSVFRVTLTDQYGCKNSDQVTVEVRKRPVANAGPDQVLEYLFETDLEAVLDYNYETGTWTILSGTGDFDDENNPVAHVSDLSLEENILIWTVDNGACPVSMDTVNIIIHDLVIPTLITRNMDGKNDFFIIKGVETFGKTELVIFNRWGAQVYKNSSYDNSWDGVDDNANPLPDDTYFFILKPEKSRPIRGYVVIRR